MSDCCYRCQKKLEGDEIGLNRKIVNRQATQFLCISCLADHFKTSEAALCDYIDRQRANGCALFAPKM